MKRRISADASFRVAALSMTKRKSSRIYATPQIFVQKQVYNSES
ncbi:hypothetical protein [Fischerella sp.]|nr:hypothetical protein [Fischerella sp.]